MEYSLRLAKEDKELLEFYNVLILILMEYSLRQH